MEFQVSGWWSPNVIQTPITALTGIRHTQGSPGTVSITLAPLIVLCGNKAALIGGIARLLTPLGLLAVVTHPANLFVVQVLQTHFQMGYGFVQFRQQDVL